MSDSADLWGAEYRAKGIPSSFRGDPSGALLEFCSYLRDRDSLRGSALDLGFGTGRNLLYLASLGLHAAGIEIVPEMVAGLTCRAEALGVVDRVEAVCRNVTEPWPFASRRFDIAVDTFCYKHQITRAGRAVYRAELRRTLRPGGRYLLTLAGADDGYYGPLLAHSPNPEDRVIVDPANGIASVLFTKEDVESEFSEGFELEHYAHRQKTGEMHGKDYTRSTHVFIFRGR